MCVQPATVYYAWQVDVMIHNFLKNGIGPEQIQIVAVTREVESSWQQLQRKYPTVSFFFYEDTRTSRTYISSIRPHVLTKHFEKYPELKDCAIFYHDCDMVFTKPVNWDKFLTDDVWYLSDTISYIAAPYIKSKKFGVYENMCEIVGIDQTVPEVNEKNSGGAQYIMKNVDATFWTKVERDSEELYKFFQQHLAQHPQSSEYHPIQMWTADMWAVLWNAWYFNHTVQVVKEMEFCWPGNDIKKWDTHDIYHNAGVTDSGRKLFHKSRYIQKFPIGLDIEAFDNSKCTIKYINEIQEALGR